MESKLTEKQQKFREVLLKEANGDFNKAAKLAGYSGFDRSWFTEALQKAVIEDATSYLAANSAKAVVAMVDALENPGDIGVDKKLAASKEILDRSGISKIDKLQVNSDAPIGIFILPPKDTGSLPQGNNENQ